MGAVSAVFPVYGYAVFWARDGICLGMLPRKVYEKSNM